MTETIVHLKPREQWRPGMTVEKLKSEMDRAVAIPGVANIWTMPIINRIDMLSTGIRSELGVKVFGADLKMLEQKAREIAEVLRQVPGRARRLSRAGDGRALHRHPDRPRRRRPATASA